MKNIRISLVLAILASFFLCPFAEGDNWSLFYDGNRSSIESIAEYDGKLFVGTGFYPNESDIYVYDGTAWFLSYDGDERRVKAMKAYNGKLYAGLTGVYRGDAKILVYDGRNWSLSYSGSETEIDSMEVFDGKLYVGQGLSSGDIYVFDGASWAKAYNASGNASATHSLEVYNGRLYAGQSRGADWGRVRTYDGTRWSDAYAGYAGGSIYSLASYGGKLYAGFGSYTEQGVILAYDGSAWSVNYDNGTDMINELFEYSGTLYSMTYNGYHSGLQVLNGSSWTEVYSSGYSLSCLGTYNGRLVMGTGGTAGYGLGDLLIKETATTTTSTMASSSTTSTTTSATSTTQGACVMPGNEPPCEVISLAEVVAAINDWANGAMSLQAVIDFINSWADPATYLPE